MIGVDARGGRGLGVLFLSEVVNCNDGIASYCETLAAGLSGRAARVYLVSGTIRVDETSMPKKTRLEKAVAHWYYMPDMRKLPSLALVRRIRDIIRTEEISVINVHGLGMLLLGRLLALLTGARLVATYHPSVLGTLNSVKQSSAPRFRLSQRLFLNIFFPDSLVVLSNESVRLVDESVYGRKNRMVKIFGGTDLTHFHPPSEAQREAARTKYGIEPNTLVCALVGRLAWVKGHDLLVKAVRRLRETHPDLDVQCLFVGSGGKEREQEIRAFAHEGGSADEKAFRFVGFLGDVRDVLWASDIYVLPSRVEGFPLGAVEAMASGLAAIRTPSGGAYDQIIDGETGLIVPFEDIDGLAAAIVRLSDDKLRQRMAAASSARAHQLFGIEPMVDGMLAAYAPPARRARA